METNCMFKCKSCGKVSRMAVESDGMNFRRPAGIPMDGKYEARAIAQCSCGHWMTNGRKILGKLNPEIGCDGRCMGATGHNCECSCGGTNHGSNHA
jgi:hypothetical protein